MLRLVISQYLWFWMGIVFRDSAATCTCLQVMRLSTLVDQIAQQIPTSVYRDQITA